jgi:hypothetical protein
MVSKQDWDIWESLIAARANPALEIEDDDDFSYSWEWDWDLTGYIPDLNFEAEREGPAHDWIIYVNATYMATTTIVVRTTGDETGAFTKRIVDLLNTLDVEREARGIETRLSREEDRQPFDASPLIELLDELVPTTSGPFTIEIPPKWHSLLPEGSGASPGFGRVHLLKNGRQVGWAQSPKILAKIADLLNATEGHTMTYPTYLVQSPGGPTSYPSEEEVKAAVRTYSDAHGTDNARRDLRIWRMPGHNPVETGQPLDVSDYL